MKKVGASSHHNNTMNQCTYFLLFLYNTRTIAQ